MPWSNQGGGGSGGGPWGPRGGGNGGSGGGGGDGPWGPGGGGRGGGGSGGGSGSQGPDLTEILRRSQDRVRNLLPGGLGGAGAALAGVVILFLWGASGVYTIAPEEQGLVLRFGEHHRNTAPGLHWHMPFPIERVIKVPVLTVRRVQVGDHDGRTFEEESLMLTGDENIIDVSFVVQWQVKEADRFIFNVRNPTETVKAAAESAMREVIGNSLIASALAEGRQVVASDARQLLQSILDEYESGIAVTELLLQRADPPAAVIEAYRDVQRARADLERAINEAQAYRNSIVPQANGQAAQLRNEAQAYKEQVVARADGAANRFEAVLGQYVEAPDVTRRRIYLETMEAVLRENDKVIIDSSAEGSSGVVPYLPLPEIQRRAAADRAAAGETLQ